MYKFVRFVYAQIVSKKMSEFDNNEINDESFREILNITNLNLNNTKNSNDADDTYINYSGKNYNLNQILEESLEKEESIPIDQIHEDSVCINCPLIFVNTNEFGKHRTVNNLRVIRFDYLQKLMIIAQKIEMGDSQKQLEATLDLIEILTGENKEMNLDETKTTNDDKTFNEIMRSIIVLSQLTEKINVDTNFVDIDYDYANFDQIREYINDKETGLLKEVRNVEVDGISKYSLINEPNRDEKILRIRQYTNATDLNQYYYVMRQFERSLIFAPGRVCQNSTKLANIGLFFSVLCTFSVPVKDKSIASIRVNGVTFIMDAFIRTRIISHWRHATTTKPMISNLIQNFDKNNPFVACCQYDTPRERIQHIIKQMRQDPKYESLVKNISYKEYEDLLESSKFRVKDQEYYSFDVGFLRKLLAMDMIGAVRDFITNMSDEISNDEDSEFSALSKCKIFQNSKSQGQSTEEESRPNLSQIQQPNSQQQFKSKTAHFESTIKSVKRKFENDFICKKPTNNDYFVQQSMEITNAEEDTMVTGDYYDEIRSACKLRKNSVNQNHDMDTM